MSSRNLSSLLLIPRIENRSDERYGWGRSAGEMDWDWTVGRQKRILRLAALAQKDKQNWARIEEESEGEIIGSWSFNVHPEFYCM